MDKMKPPIAIPTDWKNNALVPLTLLKAKNEGKSDDPEFKKAMGILLISTVGYVGYVVPIAIPTDWKNNALVPLTLKISPNTT
jgi:hypothetical protein